jgi:hypothetical protein
MSSGGSNILLLCSGGRSRVSGLITEAEEGELRYDMVEEKINETGSKIKEQLQSEMKVWGKRTTRF